VWIWNWLDGGSEDESKANDEEGLDAEQKELKAVFDGMVGGEFRYYAYEPHYHVAREMFKFARYGLPSAELRGEAERLLEEWEGIFLEKEMVWEEGERERERVKAAEGEEDGNGGGDTGSVQEEGERESVETGGGE